MANGSISSSVHPWFSGEWLARGAAAGWRRVRQSDLSNSAVSTLLDQAVVSGLSFAVFGLVARSSGSHGAGLMHLALTAVALLVNLQGELVTTPYTVYRTRRSGRALAEYAGSMFVHQSVLSLCGIAALLVAAQFVRGPEAVAMRGALWAAAAAAPLVLLQVFQRVFSYAGLRFRTALSCDLLLVFIQLPWLCWLAATSRLTVPVALLSLGLSSGLVSAIWFLRSREPLRWNRSVVWPHFCENWTFARWALASHLIGCAMTYVLPWLLLAIHGAAATGTFAGCGKVSALAAMFVTGIAHSLTPLAVRAFHRGGAVGLTRILVGAGSCFVVCVGAFCLAVSFSGNWLMPLLFGTDYADTGAIVSVLAWGVLCNSLAIVAGNGLWALGRPQSNLFADVAATSTTLAGSLLLVHTHGALGLAWAMLAGNLIGAAVRLGTLILVMREAASTATSVGDSAHD